MRRGSGACRRTGQRFCSGVAGEVCHLASRSANAANDIRKLIDASADKVQSGSQQVHAAGRTMEDIVAQVKTSPS